MFLHIWIISLVIYLCSVPNCNSIETTNCAANAIDNECLGKEGSIFETELESKRRKAEEYLSTLMTNREDWIDPHDMFNFRGLDNDNVLNEPTVFSVKRGKLDSLRGAKVHAESNDKKVVKDGNDKVVTNDNDTKVINVKDKVNVADDNVDSISTKQPSTSSNDIYMDVKSDSYKMEEMMELTDKAKKKISSVNDAYLFRWLKKFLAKIDDQSDKENLLYIRFPFDNKILDALREALQKEPLHIQPLNDIIEDMISDSVLLHDISPYQSFIEQNFFTSNFRVIIVGLIVFTFLVLFCSFVRNPKLTLLMLFFGVCVFWHWMHLYQQKLAQKHYQLESINFDKECSIKDFGIFQKVMHYVSSFFSTSGGKCEKYYEALMVDPIWEVSLSVAVSDTIANCLFQPLKVFSKVVNYCVKELFFRSESYYYVLCCFICHNVAYHDI